MNNLLIAEMFDGDRMQTLASLQPPSRCTNVRTELPNCAVKLDAHEMLPEAPPATSRDFDLIRI